MWFWFDLKLIFKVVECKGEKTNAEKTFQELFIEEFYEGDRLLDEWRDKVDWKSV